MLLQNQGQNHVTSLTMVTSRVLPVTCVAMVIAVFVLDSITSAEVAVAVLYVGIVLLSVRFLEARGVVLVSFGIMALTVLGYFLSPHNELPVISISNRLLSLAAIGVTTFLAVQSQSREMALREQAGLLNLTHDTIFVRDMDDAITYWNRGAEELYGWKKEEVIGKITHQVMQTIFPKPLKEITAELLRTGRWEGELVHTTKGGTQAIVTSRWALQRGEQGRPIATLETNNDITERKKAEEALHKAEAELLHVTRVTTLSALTTSLAHEINQPLAAMVTNAGAALRWLGKQPPNLDEARATLGFIEKDGQRAGEVIGTMRALLKKTATIKKRVDLTELIEDTITVVHGEVRRHAILLRTELAHDLPLVLGDHVQLQQVMLNLIMNGIEAMKEVTSRPRELLIRSQREASGARVAVHDVGVGLDQKSAERVFEAFYTTKPNGLGMGLAICRSIIEAHDGRLWASAQEPHGAAFQFSVPSEQGGTAPAANRPPPVE